MKYLNLEFLRRKIKTPALKEVLTDAGAKLMALGASKSYRMTTHTIRPFVGRSQPFH